LSNGINLYRWPNGETDDMEHETTITIIPDILGIASYVGLLILMWYTRTK